MLGPQVSKSKFTIKQGFWCFSREGGRFPRGFWPGSTQTQASISRAPSWALSPESQMPHQTSWVWDSSRRKHRGFLSSESLAWSWDSRLTAVQQGYLPAHLTAQLGEPQSWLHVRIRIQALSNVHQCFSKNSPDSWVLDHSRRNQFTKTHTRYV